MLDAAVNPKTSGKLYAKVYDVQSGKQLSADRIAPVSQRLMDWSPNGLTYFHYGAEITVYEGDWDHKYKARFELWFVDESGHETKMAEMSRMINGWEF